MKYKIICKLAESESVSHYSYLIGQKESKSDIQFPDPYLTYTFQNNYTMYFLIRWLTRSQLDFKSDEGMDWKETNCSPFIKTLHNLLLATIHRISHSTKYQDNIHTIRYIYNLLQHLFRIILTVIREYRTILCRRPANSQNLEPAIHMLNILPFLKN